MLCALYDSHGAYCLAIICFSYTELPWKRKAENYQELVEDMPSKFKDLNVKMSAKVHYLFSHLDCFSTKLGDLSKEHAERFHQDIKVMEERHQGWWDVYMMADYCWSLQRDCLVASHSRKSNKRKFVSID